MWTKRMFKGLATLFIMVATIIILFGIFAIVELWVDYTCPEVGMDVYEKGKYLFIWIIMVGVSAGYLFIPAIRKIWESILDRIMEI